MPWWWLQNSYKKFQQCHHLFVKKLTIPKPRRSKKQRKKLQKKDKKFLKKSLTYDKRFAIIQSERDKKGIKKNENLL